MMNNFDQSLIVCTRPEMSPPPPPPSYKFSSTALEFSSGRQHTV